MKLTTMKNSIYLLALLSLVFCSKEKILNIDPQSDSTIATTDSSQIKESFQTPEENSLAEMNKDLIHALKKKEYGEL